MRNCGVLGIAFAKRIESTPDSLQRRIHHLKDATINIATDEARSPGCESPDMKPLNTVPRKRASVARSAGIISLAVMASRVLGLVREMVFAYFFGASRSFANDAYVIAFRIPNLLRDLFA